MSHQYRKQIPIISSKHAIRLRCYVQYERYLPTYLGTYDTNVPILSKRRGGNRFFQLRQYHKKALLFLVLVPPSSAFRLSTQRPILLDCAVLYCNLPLLSFAPQSTHAQAHRGRRLHRCQAPRSSPWPCPESGICVFLVGLCGVVVVVVFVFLWL